MDSPPVVKEDSSLARKRMVKATSSVLPMRLTAAARGALERVMVWRNDTTSSS
jgi:hypothetical protein